MSDNRRFKGRSSLNIGGILGAFGVGEGSPEMTEEGKAFSEGKTDVRPKSLYKEDYGFWERVAGGGKSGSAKSANMAFEEANALEKQRGLAETSRERARIQRDIDELTEGYKIAGEIPAEAARKARAVVAFRQATGAEANVKSAAGASAGIDTFGTMTETGRRQAANEAFHTRALVPAQQEAALAQAEADRDLAGDEYRARKAQLGAAPDLSEAARARANFEKFRTPIDKRTFTLESAEKQRELEDTLSDQETTSAYRRFSNRNPYWSAPTSLIPTRNPLTGEVKLGKNPNYVGDPWKEMLRGGMTEGNSQIINPTLSGDDEARRAAEQLGIKFKPIPSRATGYR